MMPRELPPAKAAVLGPMDGSTHTCEHARAPCSHPRSPLALQLFPALLMLPFPTITREARDLLSPPRLT